MPDIMHESTAASNNPRPLSVIGRETGVPQAGLLLYTDENGWDTETYPGKIGKIQNQSISSLAPIEYIYPSVWTPWLDDRNRPELVAGALNGYDVARFRQHYRGSPSFTSSRSDLVTYPSTIPNNASYPVQTGITQSVLVRPDRSLFHYAAGVTGSSLVLFSAERSSAMREIRHPERRDDERWRLRHGAYAYRDTPDYGCGTVESEWHLVTLVSWETGVVELYVDGEIRHTWIDIPGKFQISNVNAAPIRLRFLGTSTNPISGGWNGDFAHAAFWASALTEQQITRYWEAIKDKYGL